MTGHDKPESPVTTNRNDRSRSTGIPILGHYSILTTARYTHLTSHTNDQASARIDALMSRFNINWGVVK